MKNLIKAEFFRLSKSQSFWLLLILALVLGISYGISPLTGYEICIVKLSPELFSAIWICLFAVSFICCEFHDRTFGRSIFCITTRQKIFLAKALVFFTGALPIMLLPAIVSTIIATTRNGFGQVWNAMLVSVIMQRLISYIFWGFFMDSCALLMAALIRDRVGTFGAGVVFMYIMMSLEADGIGAGNSFGSMLVVYLIKIVIIMAIATFVFVKRDLK